MNRAVFNIYAQMGFEIRTLRLFKLCLHAQQINIWSYYLFEALVFLMSVCESTHDDMFSKNLMFSLQSQFQKHFLVELKWQRCCFQTVVGGHGFDSNNHLLFFMSTWLMSKNWNEPLLPMKPLTAKCIIRQVGRNQIGACFLLKSWKAISGSRQILIKSFFCCTIEQYQMGSINNY